MERKEGFNLFKLENILILILFIFFIVLVITPQDFWLNISLKYFTK